MLVVTFACVVPDVLAAAQDRDMALAVSVLGDLDHNLELVLQAMAIAELYQE